MDAVIDTQKPARSMGHIALHYARPEDGPRTAKLLQLLGFIQTQVLPLPDGSFFYRFVVDSRHEARGDGIIYLSPAPEAQRRLLDAMRDALKIGQPDEHAAVQGMRAALEADPEASFHIGVLLDSLEELERIVLELRERSEQDPDLKGRLKFKLNRARPGDADVDARLDASPLYGAVDRYAYGRNGVQAFIETDLLTGGPLGESVILELDYVFPDKTSHILSVVEL